MKINKNYRLREIAGETIVVKQGTADVNMTRIISLNSTARLLYEQLCDRDFTLQDIVNVLISTYGISCEQAEKDASSWMNALIDCKVIE